MEHFIILLLCSSLIILASYLYIKIKNQKYIFYIKELELNCENLNNKNKELIENINQKNSLLDNEIKQKFQLEKENELLQQKMKEMQQKIIEWNSLKEQSIEHAKAVIFEVGGKLSSKLIEEHKRESEEQSKKVHEKFKESTVEFHKQFESLTKSIGSLYDQVKDSKKTVDIVKQALLSPSGAGSLAEITLENILKNSGLIANTDYIMQYSFLDNDNLLRPDAIIFLPGNNIMIIDSKASKFFTELAENDDQITKDKLSSTMKAHIKMLVSKNYQDNIKTSFAKLEKKVNHISMIMFLPSESAIEKVCNIDSDFMNRAWQNQIYPTGPIGLVNILSHAKFQIAQNNQVENYKHIIDEVSGLVNHLAILYEHARKLGGSLQNATNNFDKFAATFNSRILSKAKKLVALGVTEKSKPLPNMLDRFHVIPADKITIVDGEAIDNNIEKIEELADN